jgi:hypothetical protein
LITDDDLIAAAATIGQMPQPVVSQRLAQLEQERERRARLAALGQGAPMTGASSSPPGCPSPAELPGTALDEQADERESATPQITAR